MRGLVYVRAASGRCGGLFAVFGFALSALAWGPHSEITQAALDVLGKDEPLVVYLGPQAQQLPHYAWMPDYFGVVVEDPTELFYADDYLLFPEMRSYLDHTGPDIMQAFRPFYRRTLQALRTEDQVNAARWIGALTHFAQDALCPPHAAGLRGDVHNKMESWLETNRIRIPDHPVKSLGATDDEALQGLLLRLKEMFPEALDRGRRLRVPVEIGNRSTVRPVVLESAIDSARLTADLLHTLGQVWPKGATGGGALRGTVSGRPPVGMERFPAKVMLQGTSFSTLANLEGSYEFRHLPASNYTVVAFRVGRGLAQTDVKLRGGETNVCDLALPGESDNLVPNGDFKLSWVRSNAPDYWYQTRAGWEGLPILLKDGQSYRLTADFKKDAKASIAVRWTKAYDHAVPRFQIIPRFNNRTLSTTNREMVFTAGPNMGLIHLTILGRTPPPSVCESIRLVPVTAAR
jgi:hypothetical protein